MTAPLLSSPGVTELFVETADHQADVPDDSVKEKIETEEKTNEDETLVDEEISNSFNWKKELPCVIRSGDIDRFEEIMEAEDFDINTTWFQENLLMIAIRAGQIEMAEFLIDNGINYNFTRTVLDYKRLTRQIDCYVISCRQLAYDHQMTDIVNLIDQRNKQLFSFIKLRQRTPRIHVPKRLATDDSAEVQNSSLDLSAGERLEQEKKSVEIRQQCSANSYHKKGLNLHRFTPDLILLERKKGQQIFLPFYKNFPTSGAGRNCISSADQEGITLGSLSNNSLTVRPQQNTSSDWSLEKKNDQRPKSRLTATCWASKSNSGRITSIERQFQEISCGDVTPDRGRTQTPTPYNWRSLTYKNSTKWKNRPKSWIPKKNIL